MCNNSICSPWASFKNIQSKVGLTIFSSFFLFSLFFSSYLDGKLVCHSFIGRLFHHALEESRPKSVLINLLSVCISLLDPKRLMSGTYYLYNRQMTHGSGISVKPETVECMLESLGNVAWNDVWRSLNCRTYKNLYIKYSCCLISNIRTDFSLKFVEHASSYNPNQVIRQISCFLLVNLITSNFWFHRKWAEDWGWQLNWKTRAPWCLALKEQCGCVTGMGNPCSA